MSISFRWTRALWHTLLAAAAILCGCGGFTPGGENTLDYGIVPPSTPPDPTLEFTSLEYTPASPVTVGSEVVFTATLNHPTPYLSMTWVDIMPVDASIPTELQSNLWAYLLDDGQAPDLTAGDGIYTGRLTIPLGLGVRHDLPVIVRSQWYSSAAAPTHTGEPLDTILPAED